MREYIPIHNAIKIKTQDTEDISEKKTFLTMTRARVDCLHSRCVDADQPSVR